jgi:hypothetical protein
VLRGFSKFTRVRPEKEPKRTRGASYLSPAGMQQKSGKMPKKAFYIEIIGVAEPQKRLQTNFPCA